MLKALATTTTPEGNIFYGNKKQPIQAELI
jgi:hypothetical protein